MKRAGSFGSLLMSCIAAGLLVGSASARVPFPVDSSYADSLRIAVVYNPEATGLCSSMVAVGPQTRDFVVSALDTAYCKNVKFAVGSSATMDTILAMFPGKMPHVIVHVNAGWGYGPSFVPVLTWAAQYNVGIVEIGDDDGPYLTRVFGWARYAAPYNWSPMLTGSWLKNPLDTLCVRMEPGKDVTPDSTAYPYVKGLLRNTVNVLQDSTLYFKPYGGTDGRCESDPDIYALDSVALLHMTNIGYQQGYNAVCDTDSTLIPSAKDPTCSTIVGLPGDFYCIRIFEDSIAIGADTGLRRAVVLSFQPQFLQDSVAAQQLIYDAVMYSSILHLTNPDAGEVGVRRGLSRPGTSPGVFSWAGMRGATIRVTDMSGRAVYQGIAGSQAQVRKAMSALSTGVYLMTATKNGMVRSFPYAVAR